MQNIGCFCYQEKQKWISRSVLLFPSPFSYSHLQRHRYSLCEVNLVKVKVYDKTLILLAFEQDFKQLNSDFLCDLKDLRA